MQTGENVYIVIKSVFIYLPADPPRPQAAAGKMPLRHRSKTERRCHNGRRNGSVPLKFVPASNTFLGPAPAAGCNFKWFPAFPYRAENICRLLSGQGTAKAGRLPALLPRAAAGCRAAEFFVRNGWHIHAQCGIMTA